MGKLNERMPEHIKQMVMRRKRKDKLFLSFFGGYIAIIWLLSYLIPGDVLTLYPNLGEFIQWLGGWIPSIERFGRLSSFPQIAQILFALEVMLMPIPTIFLLRFEQFRRIKFTALHWILVVLILPLSFYGYFVYLPMDGIGSGFSSRISRSVLNSQFSFALWSSILTFGVSLLPASIIKNLYRQS